MRSQIMDGGAAHRRQGRRTSDREAQAIVDCLDSPAGQEAGRAITRSRSMSVLQRCLPLKCANRVRTV